MGKAASNEKIKLRALYFNNVAVGATIAGSIVPLLAYAREPNPIISSRQQSWASPFSWSSSPWL
jgi:hypothetical protein